MDYSESFQKKIAQMISYMVQIIISIWEHEEGVLREKKQMDSSGLSIILRMLSSGLNLNWIS